MRAHRVWWVAAPALWLLAAGVHAQDVAASGRGLAATCANCHGTDGRARDGLIVPLAGMPAQRIVAAFADFRSGARPATIMHQLARGYTDEQVRLLAAYFAAQPAKP